MINKIVNAHKQEHVSTHCDIEVFWCKQWVHTHKYHFSDFHYWHSHLWVKINNNLMIHDGKASGLRRAVRRGRLLPVSEDAVLRREPLPPRWSVQTFQCVRCSWSHPGIRGDSFYRALMVTTVERWPGRGGVVIGQIHWSWRRGDTKS